MKFVFDSTPNYTAKSLSLLRVGSVFVLAKDATNDAQHRHYYMLTNRNGHLEALDLHTGVVNFQMREDARVVEVNASMQIYDLKD